MDPFVFWWYDWNSHHLQLLQFEIWWLAVCQLDVGSPNQFPGYMLRFRRCTYPPFGAHVRKDANEYLHRHPPIDNPTLSPSVLWVLQTNISMQLPKVFLTNLCRTTRFMKIEPLVLLVRALFFRSGSVGYTQRLRHPGTNQESTSNQHLDQNLMTAMRYLIFLDNCQLNVINPHRQCTDEEITRVLSGIYELH